MNRDIEKQQVLRAATPSTSHTLIPERANLANFKLSWKDVSYTIHTKHGEKQILQSVSGCVSEGCSPSQILLIQAPP